MFFHAVASVPRRSSSLFSENCLFLTARVWALTGGFLSAVFYRAELIFFTPSKNVRLQLLKETDFENGCSPEVRAQRRGSKRRVSAKRKGGWATRQRVQGVRVIRW